MTDITKNQYRIPAQDICMGDPAPFGQRWEARAPLPFAKIGDLGKALHSRFSEFRPGDLVNVLSFDSLRFAHLVELAAYRVASTDHNTLTLIQIGDTVKVPKPQPDDAVSAGEASLVVVERNGSFEVKDDKGNVLDLFVERVQAERFIADLAAAAKTRPAPTKAKAKAA